MPILNNIRTWLFVLLVCTGTTLYAQSRAREYQLKAAFLFNFTQFVEWPAGSFSSANSPAIIGVVGKNPFGKNLHHILEGEELGGHPIILQEFDDIEDISHCHILYINITDREQLKSALRRLSGKNILTVGDTPGFSSAGGMITLVTKNDKINIEINLEAARGEHLTISSKLLRLAKIVKSSKQ